MRLSRVGPVLLLLLAVACAGRNPNTDTTPRRERNAMRITEIQEGAAQGISNLYDLVVRNHPEWLRTVTAGVSGETTTPSVWMDTQRLGTLSALRSIPLGIITSVRLLSPSEARGELGFNNPAGAILVSSH